ncbi:MAG: CBS domain-containing protein [Gammaproteobacteria bacterium]|nr:CBS domain-containing protein [Gammaproteobacteria bacterium]NIR83349.1 CBS domain-containing protein [Gammaproteobacteria bacterium]NIR91149.1 CBS domain-containing protein [Gammaproteobacteria bacterium]NIU04516.1 CBS domain-containing protein [Gammaproteobacteria bacterium]NIW87152.1 CBS domain-containing protein [Gammaproteobacteria bacterium]
MLKSVTVKDYMEANLVTFSPEMEILRAIHALVENRISGAPVTDEHGNLVGVLSEQDCMKVALNAAYHEEWGGRVSEFMNHEVNTVEADMSIVDVAELFLKAPYRRYPVVQDNRLVGQISRRDVLKALEFLW